MENFYYLSIQDNQGVMVIPDLPPLNKDDLWAWIVEARDAGDEELRCELMQIYYQLLRYTKETK